MGFENQSWLQTASLPACLPFLIFSQYLCDSNPSCWALFPLLSGCLQGQSLAVPFYCLQLNETANPESAFGARKIEQEMPLFLFLNSKSTELGAQWSLLLPQEGCCPSLRGLSLLTELPGCAGFCAVAVTHGCRKPCQGQAKGVGGSSLIKPGFRTSSVLSSLMEYGLEGLRPQEGSSSLKSTESKPLVRFRVAMLGLGAVTLQQTGLHKAQQLQSAFRAGGQRVAEQSRVQSPERCSKGIM